MEVALRDAGLVTRIVQFLGSDVDRRCAALVCRLWSEAVAWSARKLVLRTRASLPDLARRCWHITELDLSQCQADHLEDRDLEAAAAAFPRLRALRIGDPDAVQRKLTEAGVAAFASAHLQQITLSSLPSLCDPGVTLLALRCTNLRVWRLEDCRSLGDAALEAIAACPNLEELTLKGEFKLTSSGLAVLGQKSEALLKLELELGAVNIDLALKSVAQGCPRLAHVSLKCRAASLGELSRCTSLRSLALQSDGEEDRLDEAVVAIATANANLTELTCVNRLSDSAVMSVLFKCPRLQQLHLDALNLTEGVLPCIQQCASLTDLMLDNFQSTGQGLAEIGLCGLDFRSFSLTHAHGVRDMELQMLMDGNRQLARLDLRGCSGPTAIGYSAIALCSQLQFLDLSYTTVDDLSLISIASGVKALKELTVVKCEGISSMSAVARFSSLECLVLDHCSFVTDRGLYVLSRKCPRITHLSLAFTRVSDTGLDYLSKCQTLRSLRIPYCKGVRGAGLITIAKACGWFQHVVVGHRFRVSSAADMLRQLGCIVRFEMDETALVPFGAF